MHVGSGLRAKSLLTKATDQGQNRAEIADSHLPRTRGLTGTLLLRR